ncbi:MAG TPA: DUF4157 domain-containing protein [Thermoanaerobaculia bacterium]|jgi:hypothetical protein|nr:DUF4157 domain-containing protein [Thermoanaerobaculia bacterium]
MLSGATRSRQRDDTLPPDRPRSEREPRPSAPGPHFAHDFTRVPVQNNIQAKLKVNTPGDSYEQEADRVAHELSEESCACGGKCSSCSTKRVQRKSGAPTAESADVDPILNGPGHALDSHTRSFMEPYFGHDFSRVRVHSDPTAAASADSLGARAYTVGHHLVFGPGEYRPRSAEGQRLLAHELTHVMQQSAAGPMIQRDDKPITRAAASKSPKLLVKQAAPDRQPACACLVFMHHSEVNARKAAEAMHALCRYNLAIIDPKAGRNIDVPNVGERDPNELFPRHIFRECVDDDKPCQSFIDNPDNQKSTKAGVTEEFVQRQFFLAVKQCSKGFSLPIIALHTNVVTDTAKYSEQVNTKRTRLTKQLGKTGLAEDKKTELEKTQADLEKIKGKTFLDKPPDDGKWPADTLPYSDLEQWQRDHTPDAVKERDPKAKDPKRQPTWKKKLESSSGGLLAGGMTNIFKWCQAHDNSRCYIGDPDRPNNVVWVTKEDDFKKLQGTKANVVLQTRVTPGESETDLSSMFVGDLGADAWDRFQREPAPPKRKQLGGWRDDFPDAHSLGPVFEELQEVTERYTKAEEKEKAIVAKRQAAQFVNVETPQATASASERLAGYRDVRSVLQTLGLHCCDAAADKQVEETLDPSLKPKAPKKKK